MYRILLIETGEYLYRDKHGNLCLYDSIPSYIDKREYKIAEYKTRDKANMIFTRKNEANMIFKKKHRNCRIILEFVITLSGQTIYLNKQSRCLFEVMEV